MNFLLALFACFLVVSARPEYSEEWATPLKLPVTSAAQNVTSGNYSSDPALKWSCGGGQALIWAYERGINWCIGGGGGVPFQIREFRQTVRQIRAWTGGARNGLRAIHISYFNGKQATAGTMPTSGDQGSYTFSVGEFLEDSIILGGNGIGTRTGYLEFRTNLGNHFRVGDLHTPYISQADNGFFTGIYGQHGTDIDHMSLTVMKRVSSTRLQDVKYPTLSSYTGGLTPSIYTTSFCNDGNIIQSQTATFTKTIGTSRTWSVGVSMTYGTSLTVSGGFPGIVNVSATVKWEATATSSYSQTTNTATSQQMSYPLQVEPRSRITGSYQWWDSQINVPYTANLAHTFTDGSSYLFPVEDQYEGAYITEAHSSTQTTYLATGERC